MIDKYTTCLRRAVCIVALLTFCFTAAAVTTTIQYKVATVSEKTLRKFAKAVVMPKYPPKSERSGSQGVAVAELDINEEGIVKKVEILEAPDEAIGNAVVTATKQWKFEPSIDDNTGQAVRLSGKLTFYFVIDGGKAIVKNPK